MDDYFLHGFVRTSPEIAAAGGALLAAYQAGRDALYSEDVRDLNPDERAAVRALYVDPYLEVGHEGIGGFAAGQAEATIRTLRKAGFKVTR